MHRSVLPKKLRLELIDFAASVEPKTYDQEFVLKWGGNKWLINVILPTRSKRLPQVTITSKNDDQVLITAMAEELVYQLFSNESSLELTEFKVQIPMSRRYPVESIKVIVTATKFGGRVTPLK